MWLTGLLWGRPPHPRETAQPIDRGGVRLPSLARACSSSADLWGHVGAGQYMQCMNAGVIPPVASDQVTVDTEEKEMN